MFQCSYSTTGDGERVIVFCATLCAVWDVCSCTGKEKMDSLDEDKSKAAKSVSFFGQQ